MLLKTAIAKVSSAHYTTDAHILLDEGAQRSFSTEKLAGELKIKLSGNLIAGRPKAALLFWFFGDFRCGALLFMVIHVVYKYKNR